MIYTLTLNPAVDYVVHIRDLHQGNIHTSEKEFIFFGGKGINVSVVLRELHVVSVPLGFLAGFTGQAIARDLKEKGIPGDFVCLDNGFSRINIKICSGGETDINGRGPSIPDEKMKELLKKLENLQDGDILVLTGSVPGTLPETTYETILSQLREKKLRFIVDAAGKLLLNTLKYHPFLIKPNIEELEAIFQRPVAGVRDAVSCGEQLRKMGARNVLVSMGASGAVLLDDTGKEHFREPIEGKTVHTVGAGDSMVAGFIAGYERTKDYAYALELGVAAGSATAFCQGLAGREEILSLFNQSKRRNL